MNPDLFAWVGDDEFGSGAVGIKQARVPAGLIPLVAVDRRKMDRDDVIAQLRRQALTYGTTIRLVRYVAVETVVTLNPKN
jgi:hypothetical protein